MPQPGYFVLGYQFCLGFYSVSYIISLRFITTKLFLGVNSFQSNLYPFLVATSLVLAIYGLCFYPVYNDMGI